MSTREKLAVGSAERLRSPKTPLTTAALSVAVMLWNLSPVQAGPVFHVDLSGGDGTSPGFSDFFTLDLSDSAPLDRIASGGSASGAVDAKAGAHLGPLGVNVHVNSTAGSVQSEAVQGGAGAKFQDDFSAFLPGKFLKGGTLQFTLGLHGTLTAKGVDRSGIPASTAIVHARFLVTDQVPVAGFISPAGIADFTERADDEDKAVNTVLTVKVPTLLGIDNQILIASSLDVLGFGEGGTDVPGGPVATADFLNTFSITAIKLFDDQGHFIENVTLTDSLGNKLQVGPLTPAVPEPFTLTLLGIGTFGSIGYGWRRKRAVA